MNAAAARPRHAAVDEFSFCLLPRQPTSAFVKVCGCRPHDGGAAHTGAGVRKPPKEETAGGVTWWRVRRYGIWRLWCLSAGTTFAIWHELCEWVKTPFVVPVISKSYAL